MRRRKILALAVVGIFLVSPAAISMAGGWHHGSSSGTYGPAESHSSMGSDSQEAPSGPASLESREALETGKLPPREGGMSSGSGFRGGGEVQTVESGGLKYRLEIDAGA